MKDKVLLKARRDARKEKIITNCRRAFSDYGIESTSITHLCKYAKVNPKVMYDFFRNKDEIVIECANRGFNMLSETISKHIIKSDKTLFENIDSLIDELYSSKEEVRFLYQVLISPTYKDKLLPFASSLHATYEDCKKALVDKYGVDKDKVEPLFNLFVAVIDCYCLTGNPKFINSAKPYLVEEIKKHIS